MTISFHKTPKNIFNSILLFLNIDELRDCQEVSKIFEKNIKNNEMLWKWFFLSVDGASIFNFKKLFKDDKGSFKSQKVVAFHRSMVSFHLAFGFSKIDTYDVQKMVKKSPGLIVDEGLFSFISSKNFRLDLFEIALNASDRIPYLCMNELMERAVIAKRLDLIRYIFKMHQSSLENRALTYVFRQIPQLINEIEKDSDLCKRLKELNLLKSPCQCSIL